jgi:hypothetical protein
MERPVARTSAQPNTDNRRPHRPRPARHDPEARPRPDAAPAPDSPKPHGDDLLDAINPLRHVAKDLT